jgi:chromosome segregation ATPase
LNQQTSAQIKIDLENTVKALTAERDLARKKLDSDARAGTKVKAEVETLSKALAEKTAKIQAQEIVITESKVTINKLKTLGRTLKGKLEKEEEEGAEKAAKIHNLEDTISEKESVIIKLMDEINKLVYVCQSYRNHLEEQDEEVAQKRATLAKIEKELKKARQNPKKN